MLEFCGLIDYRKRTVRKLSGGMKRKLMVCRALLTEPEILLLDEPTAGMDALARRQMWNLSEKLNQQEAYHSSDNALYGGSRNAL
ncbi:MAG: ATP-binding cassette domain-containing protein [Clostridium fessum]